MGYFLGNPPRFLFNIFFSGAPGAPKFEGGPHILKGGPQTGGPQNILGGPQMFDVKPFEVGLKLDIYRHHII